MAGLGAIHKGMAHSHYSGLLSLTGLPSLTLANYKTQERESGAAIEAVAKESCDFFTEVEKQLSTSEQHNQQQIVKVHVGVSYDMGWRKRGRSHDSSSGTGTAVGMKTGKVLSYAT